MINLYISLDILLESENLNVETEIHFINELTKLKDEQTKIALIAEESIKCWIIICIQIKHTTKYTIIIKFNVTIKVKKCQK